jgi:hypothetical protein
VQWRSKVISKTGRLRRENYVPTVAAPTPIAETVFGIVMSVRKKDFSKIGFLKI